jgi:hypothetical protein
MSGIREQITLTDYANQIGAGWGYHFDFSMAGTGYRFESWRTDNMSGHTLSPLTTPYETRPEIVEAGAEISMETLFPDEATQDEVIEFFDEVASNIEGRLFNALDEIVSNEFEWHNETVDA